MERNTAGTMLTTMSHLDIQRRRSNSDSRWLFSRNEVLNSPSRQAKLTLVEECRARSDCQDLMAYLGRACNIKLEVIASAAVYMHRFYQLFPVGGIFDWRNLAPVCLFLAAKYEDSPRKLELILKLWNSYNNPAASMPSGAVNMPKKPVAESGKIASSSEPEPSQPSSQPHYPADNEAEAARMREHIEDLLVLENIVLQALGFDLQVQHAAYDITQTYQSLGLSKTEEPKPALISYKLAQLWTRYTPLSLLFRPEEIAAAAILYTCRKCRVPLLGETLDGAAVAAVVSSTTTVSTTADTVNTNEVAATTTTTIVNMPDAGSAPVAHAPAATDAASSAAPTTVNSDWLAIFNTSIRRYTTCTRRPKFSDVTKKAVENCIEEVEFWAKYLPRKVANKLLDPTLSAESNVARPHPQPMPVSAVAATETTLSQQKIAPVAAGSSTTTIVLSSDVSIELKDDDAEQKHANVVVVVPNSVDVAAADEMSGDADSKQHAAADNTVPSTAPVTDAAAASSNFVVDKVVENASGEKAGIDKLHAVDDHAENKHKLHATNRYHPYKRPSPTSSTGGSGVAVAANSTQEELQKHNAADGYSTSQVSATSSSSQSLPGGVGLF